MRKLKIIIVISIVIFSCSLSKAQSSDEAQRPLTVISNYKVDAKAPFLTEVWLWVFLGLAPDSFTLYESTWSDSKAKNFSILLVDDDGIKWVELYSDTLKKSVVKLPKDTLKTMGVDGIKFIRSLLKLFADTGQRRLDGKITLGDSLFNALAVDIGSTIPNTRRFLVRTYDSQDTYIDGEVLTENKNGAVTYRKVEVFVKKSGLRLKLTLLNNQTK